MSRLGRYARHDIHDRIDSHAKEIDATILQDRIFEADDDAPETLYHLATATEATEHAMADRELSDPVKCSVGTAFDAAHEALEQYIDELVARECLAVIEHADKWVEMWDLDASEFEAAKHAAREWLQQHLDAARRAGVLDELDVSGSRETDE